MQTFMKDYYSSILYVILTAVSFNFLSYISKNASPFLILMIGCIIAIVFFHVLNYSSIKKIYTICFQNKYSWLKIMVFILINWVSAFLATCYGSAFVYIYFSFSTSAIVGMFYKYYGNETKNIKILICFVTMSFMLILTCCYLVLTSSISVLYAVFFAILSGVSGYCYSAESAAFSKLNNLSASQILATRFWLLLIFSAIIVYVKSDNIPDSNILFYSCLVGLSTFIVPIYLFQHGVLKLGASKNSIIRGFTPVATFIIQYLMYTKYSLVEFISGIIFSLILVLSMIKTK